MQKWANSDSPAIYLTLVLHILEPEHAVLNVAHLYLQLLRRTL